MSEYCAPHGWRHAYAPCPRCSPRSDTVQPGATPSSATEPTVPRLLKSDSSVSASPSDATMQGEPDFRVIEAAYLASNADDSFRAALLAAFHQGASRERLAREAAEQSAERMATKLRAVVDVIPARHRNISIAARCALDGARAALSAFEAERAGKGTR